MPRLSDKCFFVTPGKFRKSGINCCNLRDIEDRLNECCPEGDITIRFFVFDNSSKKNPIFIVGDRPELGSWDPKKAIPLKKKDNLWKGSVKIKNNKTGLISYKPIRKGKCDVECFPGNDRSKLRRQ